MADVYGDLIGALQGNFGQALKSDPFYSAGSQIAQLQRPESFGSTGEEIAYTALQTALPQVLGSYGVSRVRPKFQESLTGLPSLLQQPIAEQLQTAGSESSYVILGSSKSSIGLPNATPLVNRPLGVTQRPVRSYKNKLFLLRSSSN